MGKAIGIVSLKGGVGKTTTVSSLGAALSDLGKKVLLVDANFSAPNLGLHLNIIDPEKTLHHVLDRSANVAEAIYEYEGFDVLPASLYFNSQINPLKLKDKIKHLKNTYDMILIDSSPRLDDETLGVILAADEIFIVTTPDHATLSTTMKAIKLARQRGTNINGLIINKAHGKKFDLSIEDIEDTLDMPVLAVIPYDKGFLRALAAMEPFTMHKPNSNGSVEIKKLASALAGQKYDSMRLKDFFTGLKPRKQELNRQLFYQRIFE